MTAPRLRARMSIAVGFVRDRAQQEMEARRRRPRGLAHHQPRATTGELERALALGVEFLRSRQRPDGVWSGFLLPPGASTSWLTSHVAFVVEDVPELEDSCRRAARYLASVGAEDGGWGYNRRVPVDCDSTAQALMVLGRFDVEAEQFLVQGLAAAELPDGGFPTYRADRAALRGSWHHAHAEVTALVAEALRRDGRFTSVVERCRAWLERQAVDGAFASYWWPNVHYGLWAQARTGMPARLPAAQVREALGTPRATPELAMAVSAATALGLDATEVDAALRDLVGIQLADGSWPCAPCLRLTDPAYEGAPSGAPGRVCADRTRIFSTAHCVAALHAICLRT